MLPLPTNVWAYQSTLQILPQDTDEAAHSCRATESAYDFLDVVGSPSGSIHVPTAGPAPARSTVGPEHPVPALPSGRRHAGCFPLALSLCLCLSVSVSLSLSPCLSLCLSVSICVSVPLSFCPFCLFLSISVSQSLSFSVIVSLSLSLFLMRMCSPHSGRRHSSQGMLGASGG